MQLIVMEWPWFEFMMITALTCNKTSQRKDLYDFYTQVSWLWAIKDTLNILEMVLNCNEKIFMIFIHRWLWAIKNTLNILEMVFNWSYNYDSWQDKITEKLSNLQT